MSDHDRPEPAGKSTACARRLLAGHPFLADRGAAPAVIEYPKTL